MSRTMKTLSAVAAVAVLGLGTSQSNAALTHFLPSGTQVGGYYVTYPEGISLFRDSTSTGLNLVLEKNAAFDSLEGLDITFTQVPGATPTAKTITIDDESITNVSGTHWSGFQFLLATDLGKQATFGGTFNLHKLGDNNPADNRYTSQTFSPTEIDLTGSQDNLQTAKLGFNADGGALVINANPSTDRKMTHVFEFKEIPVAAVPLPAAGWTGLSGLLGLGLMAHAKKLKKVLA